MKLTRISDGFVQDVVVPSPIIQTRAEQGVTKLWTAPTTDLAALQSWAYRHGYEVPDSIREATTTVRQHTSHSKKGKAFTVRQHERKFAPSDKVNEANKALWDRIELPELGAERIGGPSYAPEWGLSEREQWSDYLNFGASDLNRDLRSGSTLSHNSVSRMDGIFAKANPLAQPVTVYRGLKSIPSEKNASLLKRVFGKAELRVGDQLMDKAYTSTTMDYNIADKFRSGLFAYDGMIIKFLVPKGVKVLPGRMDERELIFPRETKFVIERIDYMRQKKGYEHIDPPLLITARVLP